MKKVIISLSLVFAFTVLIVSLNGKQSLAPNNYDRDAFSTSLPTDGESLINSKCMVCHAIKDSQKAMMAPPFAHIKKKYSKVYPTEEAFIKAITDFTIKPTKEKALMFGALKQFNVMPNLNYKEDEVKQIATYIYNSNFPEPEWCGKGK